MFLDGGINALPKVLEAYKSEAVWRTKRHGLHGRWRNMGE